MNAPLPRLELRWRKASHGEFFNSATGCEFACDYGLVLPIEPKDIRSNIWHEDKNEEIGVLTEVFYPFSTTTTTKAGEPGHGPYRDSSHARWDAKNLGNLPVYVQTIEGDLRPIVS